MLRPLKASLQLAPPRSFQASPLAPTFYGACDAAVRTVQQLVVFVDILHRYYFLFTSSFFLCLLFYFRSAIGAVEVVATVVFHHPIVTLYTPWVFALATVKPLILALVTNITIHILRLPIFYISVWSSKAYFFVYCCQHPFYFLPFFSVESVTIFFYGWPYCQVLLKRLPNLCT